MKVLIADDHPVSRQGVRLMIEMLPGVEVVGEANNGNEALELCAETHPDLVLMDLDMPEMSGIETIKRLKESQPETAVLVLTVHDGEEAIFDAVRAGASGYLTKSAGLEEIGRALDAMRSGGSYMASHVAGKAISYLSRRSEQAQLAVTAVESTTVREREVLLLLGEGLSARRIAGRLGISERTVNTHVGHLYRRLGVNNRVDAVREAMRLGLVPAP